MLLGHKKSALNKIYKCRNWL